MTFIQVFRYIEKVLTNKWTGQLRLNIFKGSILKIERKEEVDLK